MRIPSEQMTRERAYHLWDGDGRPDGRSIDYWLQAARELEEEEVAQSEATRSEVTQEKPSTNATRRKANG